ncbi:uncharacterized protein LOC127745751 [Arachis duranensis]|uniref:Uncharacterized protein LOC127745751 n=1 Tax=Arachis duranensis TaxID=130453 RepID=A0A9C6WH36_ARADU|nr:uncharacterized protein LOC127745751 [Arachis duranensis]XP_052115382.1 uncharacterized protein LOC127745751 [Arachis duranensis]
MIFLGLLLGLEFKVSAIVSFVFVFVCNFIFGFLPYVDNFASIGGFVSRFLLGSVLLPSRKLEVSYHDYSWICTSCNSIYQGKKVLSKKAKLGLEFSDSNARWKWNARSGTEGK